MKLLQFPLSQISSQPYLVQEDSETHGKKAVFDYKASELYR